MQTEDICLKYETKGASPLMLFPRGDVKKWRRDVRAVRFTTPKGLLVSYVCADMFSPRSLV